MSNLTINDSSIDGVLGIQTYGGRMVGIDESTELLGMASPLVKAICCFRKSKSNVTAILS